MPLRRWSARRAPRGTIPTMSAESSGMRARYDRAARRYGTWWSPVLEPTARRVLERVDPKAVAGAPAILDVGTGTGTLAFAALRRWPGATITGIDASGGMLREARGRAERLPAADRSHITFQVAEADRLPFPDRSFDVAVSSFVLQLVPDRSAALREVARVLRPGGMLAFVTWMTSRQSFPPDEAFFDVVDELELPDDDREEDRSGDFASAREANRELRDAGYRSIDARRDWLDHAWDPAQYADFLEQYGEYELFRSLPRRLRLELSERTRERLGELPAEAFRWRAPVVMVTARRPA
ncbi:MAG: methyltransferase domain-containing protein [Chloroflexi bacterium]|nr:MAG: methyltransferase domain-containing protein [Chloroflexota bacterium]